MKGRRVAFVAIFCIASLIVLGAHAKGKPPKEPKPPKPGNVTTECIVFTGDLEGGQEVEGCCPNAGPFPAYTMTLWIGGLPSEARGETFEGHLFAKPVRFRENRQWIERYLVQFWTWDWDNEIPGDGDYFFEIFCDGDDIEYDETTSVLTVTVENETATGWVYHDMKDCDPCDPTCNLCYDFVPTCCDDFCDPDCRPYPCHEHITIEDVSFVLERTSDLSYCQ
jgi:hypothetical protein